MTSDSRLQNKHADMKQLEAMLDCIAEGVFTVDREKRITFFNRAAERITGFDATDAIGRPCSEIFRSDVCGERCIVDEVTQTEASVTDRRVTIIDHYGRPFTVCVNAAPLRDARGTCIGGIETFRDVSGEEDLRRRVEQNYTFQDIVSRHPDMHDIFAILPDVAASEVPVLIEGESGTGKELLARAIHNLSDRSEGPFIAVNCGALPDTLLESELFGHRKGAFTDARSDRPGRFDAARGGTLFLDEIGNISAAMQVRLLRVLQEKTYEPLGSSEPVRSDARILAATNRRLADLLSEGTFRQDLYYRLNVLRLELPPLRERRCDIPLLAEHFRRRFNAETGKEIERLDPAVYEILMRHDFPGNIRELENVIQHAFVLCRGNAVQPQHLPAELRESTEDQTSPPLTLKGLEQKAIRSALRDQAGNRAAAARQLGINPSTLYRKMHRYGID
ncbi:sigma-54 interaction domain-containing protein [Kiritimatiella glycovorans]|uniref:Transcriptional regulatory protein ZraR n=1 Tax=Kiritimatiella glycovorans TaxID=1307763 RepID=A0A0G3EGZ9_9BACT|nr:sigma 54-interacting transcriptional regulator [Kiritimatiella glycovorans]AKJ63409.1 Transcriptional regulatory protein ZraR [Kiritimatiella glycovorans]